MTKIFFQLSILVLSKPLLVERASTEIIAIETMFLFIKVKKTIHINSTMTIFSFCIGRFYTNSNGV